MAAWSVAGADHGRRHRRLCGGHPRQQRHQRARLRLALVARGAVRRRAAAVASALIGWISVRTEGIYTIMITLAIATATFYFAQQNYALFNGHSGFAGIRGAARSGASAGAIPVPSTISASALRGAGLRGRALRLALDLRPDPAGDPRQPAPHARARLRRHRAQGLRLAAGRRHRRARRACCWSGSTAASRRAPSASSRRSTS